MSRLTFASLCLAAAPAFGQDIGLGATTQPFWETDPAYQDSDSPALAVPRSPVRLTRGQNAARAAASTAANAPLSMTTLRV